MALADQEIELCAEADNAAQAIAKAKLAQPDICLVGSELPGGGMAAVQGLHEVSPSAAIIVLGSTGDESELLVAVRAGAMGCLPGTVTRSQIRRVFRAVIAGEAVVPHSMIRPLVREVHGGLRSRL
jgi:DNA-binding NarL/FixJ family response regulator